LVLELFALTHSQMFSLRKTNHTTAGSNDYWQDAWIFSGNFTRRRLHSSDCRQSMVIGVSSGNSYRHQPIERRSTFSTANC